MNTATLRLLVGGGVGFLVGSYSSELGLLFPLNIAAAIVAGYIASSLVQEPTGDS